MPRANRHFLTGHVWHITHRCHQKQFLLKFARDRRRYLHWVFEAKKRFGLSVLNYVAKLTFKIRSSRYILYINKTPPYLEQESAELGDEVIARLNPETGEIENLEVLFFSTRLLRGDLF